jgi:NhaP-type Na+/H+ and K+/H+ antiporter
MAAYCAGLTMGNVRYNYKRSQVRFNNGLAWLMQVFMFTVLGMLVTFGDLISIPERGIFYDFVRHILYGEPCVVDAEETFELTRACLAARDFADKNQL